MIKQFDKILIGLAVIVLAIPFLVGNIVIQPTGSLPRGLYVKNDFTGVFETGDCVSVSFMDVSERPNIYPLPKKLPWHSFIKIVAGVPEDLISISDNGLYINGKYHGPVFQQDSKGRPLVRVMNGRYRLEEDWYFVTTPHPRSFDSRYYGPAHISQIKLATPLWLLSWDDENQMKGKFMDKKNAKSAVKATMKNAGIYELLFDPTLTEIMVNPDWKLWVDRLGSGVEYTGEQIPPKKTEAIIRCVASLNNTVCHKDSPLLEADLIDFGYARFQGVLPPVTHAPAFSIRRKAILNFSLDELASVKFMATKNQVTFIKEMIAEKKNIIISGATNTGKTTFANAVMKEFPETDRVVTLEDTMELETSIIRDCFPLRTMNGTVTMDDLLRTALRLRPDRILIGEVRGKEAWSLLKALSSGHSGGLCTVHAHGGLNTLMRLEQLVLEASIRQIPKTLIGEVIDLIIHIGFDAGTGVRKVADITRVHGFNGNEYVVEKIG